MKSKCCMTVSGEGKWGSFHPHRCTKNATSERDGKSYCSIHDPEKVAAKKIAREAKWDEESKSRQRKWDRESAIQELCQNVDTEIIQKLGEGWLADHLSKLTHDPM